MGVQETKLRAIADAIREKDGTSAPIPAGDFPDRIRGIPAGGLPEDVHAVAVAAAPPEGGSVSGGGVASRGMTVTVKAESAGTHQFKEWRENGAAVGFDGEYTFPVESDRNLEAVFEVPASRLPEGYIERQYLEKTDVEGYVMLPYVAIVSMKMELDIEPTGGTLGTSCYLYSANYTVGNDSSAWSYFSCTMQTYGVVVTARSKTYGGGDTTISADSSFRRMKIEIDLPNKIGKVNGGDDIALRVPSANRQRQNIFLTGNTSSRFVGKIYSCKLHYDGILEAEFIPCTNPNGAVGMYNLVTKQFTAIAGTGILAGPAV